MKWKEKEKESKSIKQPAGSQQYIYQSNIQYIVPNTFSNKEPIAHKDSLHNQFKKIISYPSIVWGWFINHFPTFSASNIFCLLIQIKRSLAPVTYSANAPTSLCGSRVHSHACSLKVPWKRYGLCAKKKTFKGPGRLKEADSPERTAMPQSLGNKSFDLFAGQTCSTCTVHIFETSIFGSRRTGSRYTTHIGVSLLQ